MTAETIVSDEMVINDIARYVHAQRHRSQRTYFCESDRTFAEKLLEHFNDDRGWIIVEDNRD